AEVQPYGPHDPDDATVMGCPWRRRHVHATAWHFAPREPTVAFCPSKSRQQHTPPRQINGSSSSRKWSAPPAPQDTEPSAPLRASGNSDQRIASTRNGHRTSCPTRKQTTLVLTSCHYLSMDSLLSIRGGRGTCNSRCWSSLLGLPLVAGAGSLVNAVQPT